MWVNIFFKYGHHLSILAQNVLTLQLHAIVRHAQNMFIITETPCYPIYMLHPMQIFMHKLI